MTSKLLIGCPDINLDAVLLSTSQTRSEQRLQSLRGGKRQTYFWFDSSYTAINFDYDLGSILSGVANTAATDFLCIGRADLLQSTSGIMMLSVGHQAAAGGAATDVYTLSPFQAATLYGPDSQDFVATWTTSDAYRRWRVCIKDTAGSYYPMSKLYLGSFFDMGKDPTAYSYEYVNVEGAPLDLAMGSLDLCKPGEPRLLFRVKWDLITDAKAESFCETVLDDPQRRYVFLYTSGNDQILADNKLVYCRVLSDQCSVSKGPLTDQNTITAAFVQDL